MKWPLRDYKIICCVGSGGVGKTTTAAALALRAAMDGKRTLVLTIDPARRLANSLGLKEMGNEETRIDPSMISKFRVFSAVWQLPRPSAGRRATRPPNRRVAPG